MKNRLLSFLLIALVAPVVQAGNISFLQTNESKAEELYNKALNLEVQSKQDKALIYYKDILTRYPDTQTANAAQKKLDKMNIEQNNRIAETLYQQALKHESNRDLNKAWLYYRDVIERYPNTHTAQVAQKKLNTLPPSSRYITSLSGTSKDIETGLMWMRCLVGQQWNGKTCIGKAKEFTWEEAEKIRIDFAGYGDWRMPVIDELRTLIYCSDGKPTKFSMDGCDGYLGKYSANSTIVQEVFPSTYLQICGQEIAPWEYHERKYEKKTICFRNGQPISYMNDDTKTIFIRLVRNP